MESSTLRVARRHLCDLFTSSPAGVSKFANARPDRTFPAIVKDAYDYALTDLGLEHGEFVELVDSSVASYFSDHFSRQFIAGIMVQDYLGLCPKPGHRVEGGGATGGIYFQEAWKSVASGNEEFLPECPLVLALIEFEGADMLFLGRLLGVDPDAPTLDWIGVPVGLRFRRNNQFKPTDVYFYPLRAKDE